MCSLDSPFDSSFENSGSIQDAAHLLKEATQGYGLLREQYG